MASLDHQLNLHSVTKCLTLLFTVYWNPIRFVHWIRVNECTSEVWELSPDDSQRKFIQISILIPKTHTTEEEDPIVTKFIEKIPKLMDGKSDQNDDTVRNNFD